MGLYRNEWRKIGRLAGFLLLAGCLGAVGGLNLAAQTAARLPDAAAAQLRAQADKDFATQNFSDALENYLRVYPNYGEDFELNRRIGWIYFSGPRTEWRRAIPFLRKANQLQPTNVDVLRDLASVTSWAAQYDESIPLYRELVRRSADVPGFRLNLARVLSWAGRTSEAVAEYNYYLSRWPSDMAPRVELGQLLSQQKDYAGARRQYEQVLDVQPRNVAALFGMAQIKAWSGELHPALAQIEEVLKIQPQHFDARTLKAYVYAWLGQIEESKKLFQALARENPRSSDVREGLKSLDQLEQARAAAPSPPPAAPAKPPAVDLAQKAVAEQRYDDAIELYRKHLAKSPGDSEAQLALARVLSWNRQYAESESILRGFVEKYPQNPEGFVQLARVLRWDEKYADAIEAYRKGLEVRPRDPVIHLELAQVYSYMRDFPRSLDEYRIARSLNPESLEARKGVVRALIWNGETEAARKELAGLQHTNADDPEVAALQQQLELFEIDRARTQSPERAAEYLRAQVEKDPQNIAARVELADMYLARGEFPPGIKELRAALELKPDRDDLRLKLGRVLSWNREYPESIRLYREWMNGHPDDQNVRLELARVLSWNKDYDGALAEYQEILKSNPNNTAARLEMARVLSWAKQYGPALENYDQVLEQDPKNYDAWLGKGRVYTYQSRWSDSLKAYDAALKARPKEPEATRDRAQALLWSGDAGAAQPILADLHAENPTDTAVLISLASAENALARPDRALSLLDEAQRLEPTNADAATLRKQIRAALRPELTLTGGYARDTDALNSWRYAIDFRFSLHPRVRNFITIEYLPSSALAGLFGYSVPTASGLLFAPRVPVNPLVPSPTLLSEEDFPPEVLLTGDTRFSQSAGQFLAGASMRMNQWFGWTAGAGAVQLRHGSEDFQSLGFPSTRTRFIYTATPIFYFGRWQLSLTSSRQYWTYTPKAVAQTTHVDELSGTLTWNPGSRSRIALSYYHRQISPKFEIPALTIYDPTFTTALGTFEGRAYKKIGNGGTISATYAFGRWEKGEFTMGYEGMAFGYHHPPGLPSPEFFLNTGVFTPPFYQRHAGLMRLEVRPSGAITWDVHGSLGAQQFLQKSDLALSPTAGSRLDVAFTSHVTLTLAYEYFNSASAAQAAILRPSRSYHSNYGSVGLRFRF